MPWAAVGIGTLIVIALLCIIWAARAVASRADDQMEERLANQDEPRCDITGQRLTAREQFERECG